MPIRKEALLKPLLDFEARLGFKLAQLTGHRAQKWMVELNGNITYQGVVTIREELQSALFHPKAKPEYYRVIITLLVEGEDANYCSSEQMQGYPDSAPVTGLWENNSNAPEEYNRYYYFDPIAPSTIR
jgi:hypothetical protein